MVAACDRGDIARGSRPRTTWATSPRSRSSRRSNSGSPAESRVAPARDARGAPESLAVAILESPAESRPFEHLVLDFLAYLEFERGLSRNTLEAYRSDLLQFGRFLEERKRDALKATGVDVSDFLSLLAAGNGRPPASTATIHRKAACLRSFYRHLRREG